MRVINKKAAQSWAMLIATMLLIGWSAHTSRKIREKKELDRREAIRQAIENNNAKEPRP